MKKKATILMIMVLALLCRTLPAGADDGLIDIHGAVELTLKNNSGLRLLRQETIKPYAFKIQADGTLLPSITANAGLYRLKESTNKDG